MAKTLGKPQARAIKTSRKLRRRGIVVFPADLGIDVTRLRRKRCISRISRSTPSRIRVRSSRR
jgi:hypothetical protein